jgi:site-specific DNA-methyltransferase (adenine-specific)
MREETLEHDSVRVFHGDSRDVLKTFPDNHFDSVVCDPPYALVSIGKRFGAENAAPAKAGKSGAYARASAGFMGQKWDTGETAFDSEFWVEVMRVLKSGGHLIAFSGTRTYHRLACAIEDAGFEMRDMIAWLYGSGFPKSHDVSKGIDKAAGAVREGVGTETRQRGGSDDPTQSGGRNYRLAGGEIDITAPATDAARQWQGWGTALKPALEPIVLARKPLGQTVAANVLQHGTGALNIDASRIASSTPVQSSAGSTGFGSGREDGYELGTGAQFSDKGRWPANVILDGSEEVTGAFPDLGATAGGYTRGARAEGEWLHAKEAGTHQAGFGDSGSAARFFYSAKADAADRCGSKHPTVKPVDLMAYLVRLVTPPGGLTLDPFAGSGSTGMACLREGFRCVLIEREAEYVADIERRLAHVQGLDTPLFEEPVQKAVQEVLFD